MKTLIFSDLHGNSSKLEFLSKIIKEHDKTYCLGDVFQKYGKTIELKELFQIQNFFKQHKIITLPGNCENTQDLKKIKFQKHKLIINLNDNYKALLTHGDSLDLNSVVSLNNQDEFNILIYGHTHIYRLEIIDNLIFANPGSLAYPRNTNEIITYLSITSEKEELKFDIKEIETNKIIETLNVIR